jgi:Domain of unknown function (DUF4175)
MTTTQGVRDRLAARGALLLSLLRRENRGLRTRIVAWGALHVLAAAALVLVVLAALGGLVTTLPRPAGIVLGVLAWIPVGYAAWRFWVQPLRAVPNLAIFARLVEERRDFRDMLRAALEWSQRGAPEGQSLELVAATVDRAYDEARALQLTQLFEFRHRRRDGLLVLGAAAVLALIAGFAPQAPGRALRGLAFAWPTPADVRYGPLVVLSGDPSVLAGQDVEVVVREVGPRGPEMQLRFNDTGDLWKSRQLEPRASGDPREYAFRFNDVRSDFAYRFESGRRRTEEHQVRVVQRPIVSRLQLRLVPPKYTGRPATDLEEGRGDAVALVGTRVEIEAVASSPLASARVVPDGGPATAITLTGPLPMQATSKTARASFVLRGDLRYHFDLVDSLGHTNADPVSYQIASVEDRPPYVEVREPGGDADLPKTLRMPMAVYGADDFGLSRMTLVFRHEREGEDLGNDWVKQNLALRGDGSTDAEGRPLGAGPLPEVLRRFEWSLEDVHLYPGDWVTYYVEVEDNDEFSGHKTARSNTYRLRLPSLSELYAKIQEQDENRMTQLDDAMEKTRQLREKYEKLARELKKNPEVDWQKQKEVESALEKQKQVADQVDKIAQDLQKEVQKMQEQQIVSQDIAQKLDEIRKLMDQVQDETLRDYMQRLQEAMKQISPEELQRAMEKMDLSQEDFLKRLERTKSLLEQLQREQKLDQMIERVAEMLKQQEQVGDKTDQLQEKSKDSKDSADQEANQKDAEKLAQEQKELAEKAAELQKELDQLAEESKKAGQQQLDDANQDMKQQDPSGEMQDASEQLQQQQPQEAQPHQQQAEKTLRGLYEQLMTAQQSMSMRAQAETAEKLQKAARQVLDVSFRQEGVAKQAPSQPDPDGHGESAEEQQALVSATGKVLNDLDELSRKSMATPPQVPALLGQALDHMNEGTRAYERGNPTAGRSQGELAYGFLNQAVVELNRSASASCSNPGGGQNSMQKMQDAMGQQQRLNDLTRQLKQRIRDPQNPTPEERAEMMNLMGQQQAIQQQLRDIEEQARKARELLGRLDKAQEEMHEVVEDMQSENITDETLRVQERIVSRMLDAQRSLHKRDYNEERESRTAIDIFSKGGKLPQDTERMRKLRRDIDRALREGTPEEYEELVREYFKAISEADGAAPSPAPVP